MRGLTPVIYQRGAPPVPLWFRRQLFLIDPNWILIFHPPSRPDCPGGGVDPRIYPLGMWGIHERLPMSNVILPTSFWSMTDFYGNPAPPGPDTIRVLRAARRASKAKQMGKMRAMLDASLAEYNKARVTHCREIAREAMRKIMARRNEAQWTNRVFIRTDRVGVDTQAA